MSKESLLTPKKEALNDTDSDSLRDASVPSVTSHVPQLGLSNWEQISDDDSSIDANILPEPRAYSGVELFGAENDDGMNANDPDFFFPPIGPKSSALNLNNLASLGGSLRLASPKSRTYSYGHKGKLVLPRRCVSQASRQLRVSEDELNNGAALQLPKLNVCAPTSDIPMSWRSYQKILCLPASHRLAPLSNNINRNNSHLKLPSVQNRPIESRSSTFAEDAILDEQAFNLGKLSRMENWKYKHTLEVLEGRNVVDNNKLKQELIEKIAESMEASIGDVVGKGVDELMTKLQEAKNVMLEFKKKSAAELKTQEDFDFNGRRGGNDGAGMAGLLIARRDDRAEQIEYFLTRSSYSPLLKHLKNSRETLLEALVDKDERDKLALRAQQAVEAKKNQAKHDIVRKNKHSKNWKRTDEEKREIALKTERRREEAKEKAKEMQQTRMLATERKLESRAKKISTRKGAKSVPLDSMHVKTVVHSKTLNRSDAENDDDVYNYDNETFDNENENIPINHEVGSDSRPVSAVDFAM